MLDLQQAQAHMNANSVDAWVVYDFRGSNLIMGEIFDTPISTTRRSFFIIPSKGEPKFIAHKIEEDLFKDFNFEIITYTSWQNLHEKLKHQLGGYKRIAMEYSPGGAIPVVSWVDAGTVELIRSFGFEILSSSNLIQFASAVWSEEGQKSHYGVMKKVVEIKDKAFNYVGEMISKEQSLNEFEVQEFIMNEFDRASLETEDKPIVAVNENSGNPHYEPARDDNKPIKNGDWLLIDLWARHPGFNNIFADITWVAIIGKKPTVNQKAVFNIVKEARDMTFDFLVSEYQKGNQVFGWQLDDIARDHITNHGYGENFVHRTGHSIGPGRFLHASGVNLDNLETHDTRLIVPGIGFSIEPGIYLPKFGIRLENNAFIDPNKGPIITSPSQNTIIEI